MGIEQTIQEILHDCEDGLTFGEHCGLLNEEECSVGFFLVQRLLVLTFRWFTPQRSVLARAYHRGQPGQYSRNQALTRGKPQRDRPW